MVVTLEVSKLSGWLKADAACRVEGRACEGRACRVEGGGRCKPGGRRAWGGGGTQEACTGKMARLKAWGPRARAERTLNMEYMVVTLEASKLSGWLKADAACRVEGRACDAGGKRCEPGGGRACGVVAARQEACTGKRPDSRLVGVKGTRGAHAEHVAHVLDAGGVEAQRLVEGRLLPSRREGTCDAGGRGASREAGGPGVWWRHTSGMHEDGPTQGLGACAERT